MVTFGFQGKEGCLESECVNARMPNILGSASEQVTENEFGWNLFMRHRSSRNDIAVSVDDDFGHAHK